jgi:dihydroxyacetone kinase-like predicted kinase
MREEHQERLFRTEEVQAARDKERRTEEELQAAKKEEPRKQTAFISVTIGDGLSELFKQLGVDVLIQGGQTMNPSTDDMLNAIAEAHAENVFILPNNKNVILAANQAQELTTDCNVFVIPTKTIPQGITAVVSYVPDKSPEDNAADMTEEIESVKTGEVTYAVRDTKIDGVEIKSGDIMGIGDNGILAVGSDVSDVVMKMLEKITDEDSELISIYNGSDYSDEAAEALCERIQEAYPDVDVEVNDGGQPIYYIILSVE